MQAVAPVDCLAHLPGPPGKGNRCAASLHDGRLLAYAAASAVVVVDVRRGAGQGTRLQGRQAVVPALQPARQGDVLLGMLGAGCLASLGQCELD